MTIKENDLDLFQFTPLREGRRRANILTQLNELFQFTPLREGRPEKGAYLRAMHRFQFTPLREGRLPEQEEKEER